MIAGSGQGGSEGMTTSIFNPELLQEGTHCSPYTSLPIIVVSKFIAKHFKK